MRARFLRPTLAAGVVAVSLVIGTALPAAAGSEQGIVANSWIVSDLAAEAMPAAAQGLSGANTAADIAMWQDEMDMARAATTTTLNKSGTGFVTKPKTSGKLGMILNTVGTLGGLVLSFTGSDPLPAGVAPGSETFTQDQCGWYSGGVNSIFCKGSSQGWGVTLSMQKAAAVIGIYRATVGASAYPSPAGYTNYCASGCNPPWALNIAQDTNAIDWEVRGCASISACDSGNYTLIGRFKIAGRNQTMPDPTVAPEPSAVPRYVDSTATCMSPGGGSQIITRRNGPYYVTPGTDIPVPDLICPPGTWLSSGTRTLDSGTGTSVPLVPPYAAPDWVGEQASQFPECMPVGSTACQLELWKTDTEPDLDCNKIGSGQGHPCRDWYTDPNKTTRYQCRFGSNVLALGKCAPYAQTFATVTPTVTPTPDVEVVPAPTDDPTPDQTPELGNCTPAWADLLTPWWMFKATSCALSWAFVPHDPPPFSDVPSPLPVGWLPSFPGLTDGACGVVTMPSLNLGPLLPETGTKPFFDTCAQPWPTVRLFTYYGVLASALVTIGHRAMRAGMAALGMGVDTPGGGGDE